MRDAQRILRELRKLKVENNDEIYLAAEQENIRHWYGIIKGPDDTPFADRYFKIDIEIQEGYPIHPPKAKFVTPIFHPNINFKDGTICLDILKSEWTPAWGINSLCTAIRLLLSEPVADSPLNIPAGNLLRFGDNVGYYSMAHMYAQTYGLETNEMRIADEAAHSE